MRQKGYLETIDDLRSPDRLPRALAFARGGIWQHLHMPTAHSED
jgi:hypothetical protein